MLATIAPWTLLIVTCVAAVWAAVQARRSRQLAQQVADTLATYGACLTGIAVAVKSPIILPTGGGPIHPADPV